MSVRDHLQEGERIELQRPPFYLTDRRLLRYVDGDVQVRETPRSGLTAVERVQTTDHRIMVAGVVLVVGGVILATTWAPLTAWLAVIAGIAALVMGGRGKLICHQVQSPRITDADAALWQLPPWGADHFASRLRTIAAENRRRDERE